METHVDGTGKYRWVSLRVRLAEKQGNRKIYYGAFHDNDSLMQAHQALHESQEMMRAAIEHSDLQAWVYDPETGRGGAIIIDPSRHLKDYGKMDYPNDAVRSGLIHPDDVEKFLSLHQRMQAGEAEAEEAEREHAGSFLVRISCPAYFRLIGIVKRQCEEQDRHEISGHLDQF